MKQRYLNLFIVIVIGINLFSAISFADGRGAFASDSVGARPSILGEGFVAVADDANALHWNPAGIPQLLQPEFIASHVNLFSLGGYFNYTEDSQSRFQAGTGFFHSLLKKNTSILR